MNTRTRAVARWGLLATVLLTAATLVSTAVAGYLAALETSNVVVRARAVDLVFAARRALRLAGGAMGDAVAELVEDSSPQGLRFVAVLSRTGKVLASSGEPAAPVEAEPQRHLGVWPPQIQSLSGGIERVTARLAMPGVGLRRPWRDAVAPTDQERPAALILEFDPQVTAFIVARARWTLAAAIVSAVLLVSAALVFWSLTRRHEQLEAQLRKDQQLRLLGEMSAVLGHEIRNPLAALKGHAQLLEERLPDGPAHRSASTIVEEAKRLEDLAEQVLAFARTGTVEKTLTDPLVAVRAAAEAVGDARVRVSAPMDLPAWPLDRPRIEQVIQNLIRNAVQASPPEAPIEVALAVVDDTLRIDVSDGGEGIAAGEEEKVFEAFHTTRTRGTGLGLTVARRVVEGHGGSIVASNQPGGGALFRVEIPRAKEVA